MKITRKATYSIAMVAATAAAFMVGKASVAPEQPAAQAAQVADVVTPERMTEVLIVAKPLPMGNRVTHEDLAWAAWPEKNRPTHSIVRSETPDAIEKFQGVLVRQNVSAGETVTSERFVLDTTTSFLSALLNPGMRAFALPTSPVDTAGGLILPGDRVDILAIAGAPGGVARAQPLITNVKVLAIGTETREAEGQKTLLGPTVTLEVFPDQADILATVQKSSGLTMSLRPFSPEANQQPSTAKPKVAEEKSEQAIRIIRGGVATATR